MRGPSQNHGASPRAAKSLANDEAAIAIGAGQPFLNFERRGLKPESLDDDAVVRQAISSAIHACSKSREQIADNMSALLGTRVTVHMLNSYSSEAKQLNRFPAAWDRAFCRATGDDTLLICRVQLAGLFVITPTEKELLDLGRELLKQKRAAENAALLEKRLMGVDL